MSIYESENSAISALDDVDSSAVRGLTATFAMFSPGDGITLESDVSDSHEMGAGVTVSVTVMSLGDGLLLLEVPVTGLEHPSIGMDAARARTILRGGFRLSDGSSTTLVEPGTLYRIAALDDAVVIARMVVWFHTQILGLAHPLLFCRVFSGNTLDDARTPCLHGLHEHGLDTPNESPLGEAA